MLIQRVFRGSTSSYCNRITTVTYLKKDMNDFILRVTFIIIYYCGGETTIGAQQSITHTA